MRDIYFCSCVKNGGVYHYKLDNGILTYCDKTELDFPMYMIIRESKAHIILRETDASTRFGGILCFDIADDGSLINPSDIVSTDGVVPCHLEVTPFGRYAVNYLSGNVAKISDKTVTHSGHSVHKRQTEPHTHFVAENGGYIYCVDLGLDAIICYDKDLSEISRGYVPAGHGARHLAFGDDGKYIYCVNEIISGVSVFERKGSELKYLDTYAALPDFDGYNTAAAIRIDGDRLYISNRGAETITEFKITGDRLRRIKNHPCYGIGPRDFDVIDGLFFCTNEQSNDITVLKRVGEELKLIDRLEMDAPLCVTY